MGRRPLRLGEAIREEVSQLVSFELKDPRIGLVTVTRVEVSPDLGHARVHVGMQGTEAERRKTLAALKSASGFVRRELARRLGIRQVPEVDFAYDKGLEATERVAQLIRENAARSLEAAAGEGGGDADPQPERSGGERPQGRGE
ncbi:MAG TPA: 30S ribosome-binding factor RbfA [Vicinamibacteria bacterium]|nr:30S ribosome-binding factor RbfA [Vicinamibacteria bacterium]